MYIEPNTVIKFYSGIPLDNSYENTLYFGSLSAQNSYFHGTLPKHTIQRNTYQRKDKGIMRVGKSADDLYDCNYLAFQNTNYGTKWFYAFITGVDYVNNETAEVKYEIDVMQTYLFDATLKECLVVREHSLTDKIGDNLVEEPIACGDVICQRINKTSSWFDNYQIVVCVSRPPNDTSHTYDGDFISGLYSGCKYRAFPYNNTGKTDLNDFLNNLTDNSLQDTVVSIFMMPSTISVSEQATSLGSYYHEIPTALNGYTPHNNKLFTYPYSYLKCSTGESEIDYRYELFSIIPTTERQFSFSLEACCTTNPQILLSPSGYNGDGVGDSVTNIPHSLVLDGFPQLAWSIDSYRAWVAQQGVGNNLQKAVGGLSAIGGIASTVASGNPLSAIGGALALGNAYNKEYIAKRSPDRARGQNTGTITTATRTKNFYFMEMCLNPSYAKIIDEYFDKYGYATNRVKVPNRNSRKHWNYVQTNGCLIIGKMPSDDIKKMQSIYDKGITFWKNANEVGMYSTYANDNKV